MVNYTVYICQMNGVNLRSSTSTITYTPTTDINISINIKDDADLNGISLASGKKYFCSLL